MPNLKKVMFNIYASGQDEKGQGVVITAPKTYLTFEEVIAFINQFKENADTR